MPSPWRVRVAPRSRKPRDRDGVVLSIGVMVRTEGYSNVYVVVGTDPTATNVCVRDTNRPAHIGPWKITTPSALTAILF